MTSALTGWLDHHDPERSALVKAAKVAVVVTTGLALGTASGNSQLALFGTGIGFVIGAVLILLVGTTPWHLWVLLPILLVCVRPTVEGFYWMVQQHSSSACGRPRDRGGNG